jgi:hypothetical protein
MPPCVGLARAAPACDLPCSRTGGWAAGLLLASHPAHPGRCLPAAVLSRYRAIRLGLPLSGQLPGEHQPGPLAPALPQSYQALLLGCQVWIWIWI